MSFPWLFPDQIKFHDFSMISGNSMTCGHPDNTPKLSPYHFGLVVCVLGEHSHCIIQAVVHNMIHDHIISFDGLVVDTIWIPLLLKPASTKSSWKYNDILQRYRLCTLSCYVSIISLFQIQAYAVSSVTATYIQLLLPHFLWCDASCSYIVVQTKALLIW